MITVELMKYDKDSINLVFVKKDAVKEYFNSDGSFAHIGFFHDQPWEIMAFVDDTIMVQQGLFLCTLTKDEFKEIFESEEEDEVQG